MLCLQHHTGRPTDRQTVLYYCICSNRLLGHTGILRLEPVRNAMNATDATDATTDDASDRPFDTPSFTINIKLLGVCFLNMALIVLFLLYSVARTLYVRHKRCCGK